MVPTNSHPTSPDMSNRYGHRAGRRQVCLEVSWSFAPPSAIDLDRIDRWLADHFQAPFRKRDVMAGTRVSPAAALSPIPGLMARILAIYELLCHASDLPCTEAGQVVRMESRRGGQWDVTFLVPAVNEIPHASFAELVRSSVIVALDMMRRAPTPAHAQRLYDRLDSQILPRFRSLFPDGRANSFIMGLAHKQGVCFDHLGGGVIQLGQGVKGQLVHRSACRHDSSIGASVCADKMGTAMLLRRAGVPVPAHELVASPEAASAAAGRLGWPVVVKPADRERGEGVTIDIADVTSLARAFEEARRLSQRVLVEQQARGLCYRILVAGQRLVYAVKRQPKSVKGDGVKTVRQLVDEANAAQLALPPWNRLKPFMLDEEALSCLARLGLTPQSVLEDGQLAPLRPITSTQWGGSAEDATALIHPDNVALAVRATGLLGLSVAGVDLMTEDIGRPWHETGAVINEVNFKPYFGGNLKNDKSDPYLRAIVEGDGRIPVHAVVGDADLWAKGDEVRRQLAGQGVRAHLCGQGAVETPTGAPLHLACSGLFMHCTALLRSPDVEALVLVIDTDDVLRTGLPLDRIDVLHVAGDASAPAVRALLDFLSPFVVR